MKLYELIFTIFVLYLLYKLVFNVVLPVSKATSSARDKMRQMEEEQTNRHVPPRDTVKTAGKTHTTNTTDGEYIDFEEVK